MKRTRFLLVGVGVALTVAAGATITAFAGTSTETTAGLMISSGVPVERSSFSAQDQWLLGNIGETGAITKIGVREGVSFYEGTNEDGGQCFMTGSGRDGGGLSGGCLKGAAQLEQPLVDMSGVCVDPASGDWRLARIEGIAADGISAVGVVDAEDALHTTPVVGNVYRMASSDIPTGSRCPGFEAQAIVALDEKGSVVFTKSLGAS
ncbi:MAG: hypothetical protein ABSB96_11250 [Gaiellaceae bacterium]